MTTHHSMHSSFRYLLLLFVFLGTNTLFGQNALSKYWVELSDKDTARYSLFQPQEYLSARAIRRRMRDGVAIDARDFPVNSSHIQAIAAKGARIHGLSRWLNAVVVIADSVQAKELEELTFVRSVKDYGPHYPYRNAPDMPVEPRVASSKPPFQAANAPAGYSTRQNDMLGLTLLHELGHRGEGVWIVVMDGGFSKADKLPFFDSIAVQGRLFSGPDVVEGDSYIFEDAAHGTSVLSVMAANVPGYFVGTAPDAVYFLLKTEDIGSEYPIEEANWVIGVEYADSIGADIVNASLGYTTFTQAQYNHTRADLNGKSSVASRAGGIAAEKGLIVCNSAGNSGDYDWRYLGIPADAPGLIAVGATSIQGKKASFSSFGPTADGRIKPDLSAPGLMVVSAAENGFDLTQSSGTSIASPMLAGSIASLWSSRLDFSSREILNYVFQSANQYKKPDNELGWGIPNMTTAYLDLHEWHPNSQGNGLFRFEENGQEVNFLLGRDVSENLTIEVFSAFGKISTVVPKITRLGLLTKLNLTSSETLPKGYYWLRLTDDMASPMQFGFVKG